MTPARKKTTAKKATRKKKPTQKKPAAKKAPAKKAPQKARPKADGAKKTAGKKSAGKKAAEEVPVEKPAPPPKPGPLVVARGKKISKLGLRWTCWSCGAVFYDLNKPAPICPKCQTDQRVKPEVEKSSPPPPRRDSMRALRVLDDEDAPVAEDSGDEGIELDLEFGADEKLLEPTEDEEVDED